MTSTQNAVSDCTCDDCGRAWAVQGSDPEVSECPACTSDQFTIRVRLQEKATMESIEIVPCPVCARPLGNDEDPVTDAMIERGADAAVSTGSWRIIAGEDSALFDKWAREIAEAVLRAALEHPMSDEQESDTMPRAQTVRFYPRRGLVLEYRTCPACSGAGCSRCDVGFVPAEAPDEH